ncbi:MAG: hypothetical protein HPY83_08390 [Anaerolineae bacterium]|nr:hypothetical protein [Anaerolineae bacterium]
MGEAKPFHGPLRVSPTNPRYFTDDRGEAIYLTGSHTWANLVDIRREGDPLFDYREYLDFMEAHDHNFMRLWTWDHTEMAPWTEDKLYFDPLPHARTGPGLALDGKPKFDLGRWNQAYFDRLRSRVLQAGERGIYVSIMLFEAWCLRNARPASDPWITHPYNSHNNVNGVDGDPDGDGKPSVYTLDIPEVVEYQKAYIRQVVDTVNDLDHVLYEIINETKDDEPGVAWHSHMVDYVHEYERTKPKQHPVGMTSDGGPRYNPILLASNADWISPSVRPGEDYRYDPPPADGTKVIIADTDHIWGTGGTYQWAWKCFLRGMNPIFMDPWGPLPSWSDDARRAYDRSVLMTRNFPDWGLLRANLGHTRRFARRLPLDSMSPQGELASSGYCLAAPGEVYLVYSPYDAQVWVDLSAAPGPVAVEWFCPRTAEHTTAPAVQGGRRYTFVSPFGLDAVLLLTARR